MDRVVPTYHQIYHNIIMIKALFLKRCRIPLFYQEDSYLLYAIEVS